MLLSAGGRREGSLSLLSVLIVVKDYSGCLPFFSVALWTEFLRNGCVPLLQSGSPWHAKIFSISSGCHLGIFFSYYSRRRLILSWLQTIVTMFHTETMVVKSLKWRVYGQVNFRPKSLNFTIFYFIYALIDSQMRYIKGDSSFSVLPNKEDSYWMWRDFKCRRDQEKLRTNFWSVILLSG